MLPCNPGGHTAYQDTFLSDFLKFYPDHFVLSKSTWDYIVQFCHLNLSICKGLIVPDHLALAGDGTPVQTAAQQRKNESVNVRKMATLPVTSNVIILSRTVTGDGIPTGSAIFSVTTSTCM